MFALDWATPTEWVARVERKPLALLSDHAHCELKAAASAQALIVKNPRHTELVLRLSELATEEMEHFTRVVSLLERRGGTLGPQTKSPYADGLLRRARTSQAQPLLDRLLVAALIETRSLERFWLLAEHLIDAELASLYRELLPSEADHQGTFVRFAKAAFPVDVVATRLAQLRHLEAEVVSGLEFDFTVHSGIGAAAP